MTNINYLNEAAFKTLLLNENNYIKFLSPDDSLKPHIDCDDCKNYWLIKEGKEKQVENPFCKSDPKKTLFDDEIKTKLSQKCK